MPNFSLQLASSFATAYVHHARFTYTSFLVGCTFRFCSRSVVNATLLQVYKYDKHVYQRVDTVRRKETPSKSKPGFSKYFVHKKQAISVNRFLLQIKTMPIGQLPVVRSGSKFQRVPHGLIPGASPKMKKIGEGQSDPPVLP